jgi:type I restriction-modification system DNA methylase subunit
VRDYYTEKNVFWVPLEARWQTLRDCAQLPLKAQLPWNKPGKTEPEEMRSVGWLIDNAMEAIERENEKKLKNVLNKNFASTELESAKLADLIALFSDTHFHATEYKGKPLNLKAKDILGHIYEYFLGEFALAEGKKGGQYYTPKSIVSLIVNMLQPYNGRVYDPAMGSGGFFVQSEDFIEQHGGKATSHGTKGKAGQISVYGQESNPTTWKLAAMNMAIRGIDFNFGGGPGDTLQNDLHPDLRADFVMANPPFNMKEWWSEKLANDPRWLPSCTPPQGNANFAWLQHMLYHLAPAGSMALLLANGSMSSNTNNEGEIRKKLVEDDYVECMVALPGTTEDKNSALKQILDNAIVAQGAGPGPRRDRLLRRAGQQRERGAGTGRRYLEKDRRRDHRETARQHDRGLAGARQRARQAEDSGSAHAAEMEIPAGSAGGCRRTGVEAGGDAVERVVELKSRRGSGRARQLLWASRSKQRLKRQYSPPAAHWLR